MFSNSIQPSIVSLFSSTGSKPLTLFSTHVDKKLASDSFIHLLKDDSSTPTPPSPGTLVSLPLLDTGVDSDEGHSGYQVAQTVLHIQSPTLPTTYIRCPPSPSSRADNPIHLGIKHPWMCLQVRNMRREWSFEVGLVDQAGRQGIVRCSTFQVIFKKFQVLMLQVGPRNLGNCSCLMAQVRHDSACTGFSCLFSRWLGSILITMPTEPTSSQTIEGSRFFSSSSYPSYVPISFI